MSSKRELYKAKSRGRLGSRDARARLKAQESKSGREALLSSKRRIPLSSIQEEEPSRKKDELSKGELRLQKLKEWKKKRDEAKEQEKLKKKKPFYCAGGKPDSHVAKPGLKSTSKGNVTSTINSTKLMTESISKSTSTTASTSTQEKSGVVKKASASTATLKNASRNVPKQCPLKDTKLKDRKMASAPAGKPPLMSALRTSKRIAKQVQQKEPKAKAAALKRQTETRNASGACASEHGTKRPTRVTRSNSSKVLNASAVSLGAGKKKTATPVQTKLSYPDSSSDSTDTASPPSPPPTLTPHVASSPPSPPPTLTSHTAHPHNLTSREIPESAWIPAQHVFLRHSPSKSLKEFLEPCTFIPFSPFKFTASRGCEAVATTTLSGGGRGSKRKATPGKPFVFNFRKSVNITPLSLRADMMMQSDVTADSSVSVDSLDCDFTPVTMAPSTMVTKDKPTPIVTMSTDNATSVKKPVEPVAMDTENVLEEMETDPITVSMTTQPTENDGEGVDLVAKENHVSQDVVLADVSVSAWCGGRVGVSGEGVGVGTVVMESEETDSDAGVKGGLDFAYFHKLHDDVEAAFTEQCAVWKRKSEEIEGAMEGEEQNDLEDVVDQIRTTVCQAELLMRKKMKQYLGLVTNAEGDGGKTTSEDLQGFWDLVSIQVDDLNRKFQSLAELERNNWKQPQLERNVTKKRGKKRAPKAVSKAVISEREAAARERRSAMRNRLREMKIAATRKAQEEGEEREEGERAGGSSDEKPTTCTPPHDSDLHDNRGRHSSSKRKSTGKGRRRSRKVGKRTSVALIDFSQLPSGVEVPHDESPPPLPPISSGFSPPRDPSPPPPSVVGSQSVDSEVPTANLLRFTPLPPLKSPFKKWVPNGMTPTKNLAPGGASMRRFVSVTPSKRIREMMEVDLIMSPARRSIRIAEKFGTATDSNHGNYQVASLKDLPDELDVGYLPNKALF